MQYFPYYPFTNMAIEAGHITADDVSDEKTAEATMFNWSYRPKFPAFDRRDYLENCIYLLPWTSPKVRWLLRKLSERHRPVLGFVASLLAKVRYMHGFEGFRAFVWARRGYLALRLIFRGDLRTLREKVNKVREDARYAQPHTGRMSSR